MSYPPRPEDPSDDVPPRYGTPDPYAIPDPSSRDAGAGPYGVPDVSGGPAGTGDPGAYGSPPPLPPTSPYGPYGGQGGYGGHDPYAGRGPYAGQGVYARGPVGFPPPSHLVWAILSTFFCCIPIGVVSIVFGSQVSSKWATGDLEGARRASANARTWAIVSAVCGVIFWVFVIASGASSS